MEGSGFRGPGGFGGFGGFGGVGRVDRWSGECGRTFGPSMLLAVDNFFVKSKLFSEKVETDSLFPGEPTAAATFEFNISFSDFFLEQNVVKMIDIVL